MGHFRPHQIHLRHVILFLFLFNLKVREIYHSLVGWQICAFEWQVKAASTFEISGEGGRHRWRPRRQRPLPSRETAPAAAAFERSGDGGRCRWRQRRR
uniref:Uncharacterized protein n=1 Tax=Caenorhabditis japonica TaxID=281687 RepID=A0A8R1ITN4_CAEJA